MYLYFDRTGVLKEIINDESLRQGNYGINKIYVYVENRTYTSVEVNYLVENQDAEDFDSVIGPIQFTDFTNPSATTPAENCYIPYNPERDLKYFKYYTPYKFMIIDLSEKDVHNNGALDAAGTVHCSISAYLETGDILQLGDVNFKVQINPSLQVKQVSPQEYLSLSDYLYLKSLVNNRVHIDNGEQEISGHKTFSDKVDVKGELEIGEKTVSGISDGPALLFSDLSGNIWSIGTNNNNLVERDYDLTLPNDSGQLVVSSTNTNLTVNDLVVDEFIIFSDDSDKAILSRTGNKTTYYTFGDRVITGTTRSVHVATVEDTQKKLYRHTVILRTSNYIMTKIVFLSSKEEDYTFTEIKELVAGDDIYQVYPEVSISGETLQYIATYSLVVSDNKLYNIRVLFGESITKSMSELVDIYSQSVEEL